MSTVADTAVDVPASVGAHIFQIEAHHSKEMRELQAKHHQARLLLDKQSAKLEGYAKELHRLRATVTCGWSLFPLTINDTTAHCERGVRGLPL